MVCRLLKELLEAGGGGPGVEGALSALAALECDWTVRIMSMQGERKERENMLRYKELNYDKLSFFFRSVSREGREQGGSPSVRGRTTSWSAACG